MLVSRKMAVLKYYSSRARGYLDEPLQCTGCKCTVSILMLSQELVILWVTLPPGWDTGPDWGHELVLDLLPGVLLKVCLDGTWLWNLPLQFCAEQNKRAMNAEEQTGKSPPLLPQLTYHPDITTTKTRALLYSFCFSSTSRSQALPCLWHPLQPQSLHHSLHSY